MRKRVAGAVLFSGGGSSVIFAGEPFYSYYYKVDSDL